VGIAQAIIHQPKLVILDEPISGLDPVQIVEMRKVIKSLALECTVLVSSHILSEIEQTCDRILVLQEGKLVFEGTSTDLQSRKTGSLMVSMTISGSPKAAQAALDSQPGVVVIDITDIGDGRLDVRVELAEDNREQLIGHLVSAGMGIRRVEEEGDELEDIFVALTKSAAATVGDR
jgi:ABC-2 type transport system ATP-binding protein